MNYYDISNPNAPFTTGYQKGLWQKTIVQIYRVLVMIGGILGVCFIIGTGQREDYTMGMLESCMLLLVSYLVFLIMLMYASIIISAKKTEKWNLQDKHDYNLALYRTRYKDNKQLQAVTLIQMAKQQILMGHYDLAIQALEMVRTDCLKLQYLREFYFYKAAASMRFLKPMTQMVLPVKSILFMTEFQRMASVICSYISRNRWAQMRRY